MANPPTFEPPGSNYAYTNTNYVLLGQLVHELTGRSYSDEIQRRVIDPLRLRGTSLAGTSPLLPPPHPLGYVPILQDGEMELLDYTEMNHSVMGASGELVSTAGDLNRFFDGLLGGRLLPTYLLEEMRTSGVVGGTYGLGLRWRDTTCGVRVYGNDGDALAYKAWSFSTADLSRQVTIAVTPDFSGDPDTTVDDFLNQAFCG